MATPIGHLGDLTPRAAAVIAAADRVLCEDRRVTARLLRHLGLKKPLFLYNDHIGERVRPQLLAELDGGASLALVSDAGTPLLSDPGFKLVRAAIEHGHRIHPVPGASALLAALVVAGLPTDRFFFQGFLPPRPAARRAVLAELLPLRATLLLYEAPHRLAATLADAADVLGPREAVIARELTKLFEEVRRGPLDALARELAAAGPPKGEIVLVIAPPEAPVHAASALAAGGLDDELRTALAGAKPRVAAARVAAERGLPVNAVYARILGLRAADPGRDRGDADAH